jgi:transcriptional regulator with XRE-family HTH domain
MNDFTQLGKQLGEQLLKARRLARLSRQQLAVRAGVHRNSIHRYECGADMPITTFIRLCAAMGTDHVALLKSAKVID